MNKSSEAGHENAVSGSSCTCRTHYPLLIIVSLFWYISYSRRSFRLHSCSLSIPKTLTSSSTIAGLQWSGDVCSSDFAIYANECIPKLCDIHTWTSTLTVHSKRFRCGVGTPRRSTRSSIQDRAMESAIRLAQGYWKACLCVVLRQARTRRG